jgi:hypothetical protein
MSLRAGLVTRDQASTPQPTRMEDRRTGHLAALAIPIPDPMIEGLGQSAIDKGQTARHTRHHWNTQCSTRLQYCSRFQRLCCHRIWFKDMLQLKLILFTYILSLLQDLDLAPITHPPWVAFSTRLARQFHSLVSLVLDVSQGRLGHVQPSQHTTTNQNGKTEGQGIWRCWLSQSPTQ